MLRVVHDFPMDMACQVMAFNALVKDIVKDIAAIQILVRCNPNPAQEDPTAQEGIKQVDATSVNQQIDEFVTFGEEL